MTVERMLTEELPAGELVGQVLQEAGIEYVFGISGGHTGRIVSGLRKYQNSLRMVLVREESLAGVMAEVYGRLTRRPGVMIGQGPWVLGNGLIGTMEAFLSSSPMLLLTDFSDATPFHLHAPYQQATGDYGSWDARRAFSGVTKQVMQAHLPVAAVQATQLAIKHAMAGQPGPVAVLFAQDSLSGTVKPDSQPALYPTRYYLPPPPPPADAARVAAAAKALLAAERPVVIAGNGVRISQGYEQLVALAEAAGLPVATTAAGKGCFAETHSLALGVFGTFGTEAANACLAEADLVLAIGTKLGPSDTAWANRDLLDPTRQTFIQIDIEPRNASWTFPAEHVLLGDAAQVMRQLREAVRSDEAGRRKAGEARVARWREEKGYFNSAGYLADDAPILPQRAIGELMRTLPDNAIVTCDAGENRIMMTHFYQTKQAGGFLQAAGSGPMGFAIPAALAAKLVLSRPAGGRRVRRRWLRDDDERADDRHRAGHPDHHRGVQQQCTRLGAARRRSVRRRVRRLRPCGDRARHGLSRRARHRTGGAGSGVARGDERARADGDRCADVAGAVVRRHHLAAGGRRLAAAAVTLGRTQISVSISSC